MLLLSIALRQLEVLERPLDWQCACVFRADVDFLPPPSQTARQHSWSQEYREFFWSFHPEVNFIATTGQHASGEYLISCALKGASIPKTLENGLIWGLHNVRQLVYVIRQGEERQPISVWMEAVYLAVYGLRCCSIEILFRTPDPPQDRMPFFLRSF